MSDIPAFQKVCGAEKVLVECGQKESSPVADERLRKKARGAGRAAVGAKSEPRGNKGGGEQGVTARLVRKSPVRAEHKKPSNVADATAHEPVMSVTEWALMSCRDPENRKKRLKLAEALREHGFDEHFAAEMLYGLAAKLGHNKEEGAGWRLPSFCSMF